MDPPGHNAQGTSAEALAGHYHFPFPSEPSGSSSAHYGTTTPRSMPNMLASIAAGYISTTNPQVYKTLTFLDPSTSPDLTWQLRLDGDENRVYSISHDQLWWIPLPNVECGIPEWSLRPGSVPNFTGDFWDFYRHLEACCRQSSGQQSSRNGQDAQNFTAHEPDVSLPPTSAIQMEDNDIAMSEATPAAATSGHHTHTDFIAWDWGSDQGLDMHAATARPDSGTLQSSSHLQWDSSSSGPLHQPPELEPTKNNREHVSLHYGQPGVHLEVEGGVAERLDETKAKGARSTQVARKKKDAIKPVSSSRKRLNRPDGQHKDTVASPEKPVPLSRTEALTGDFEGDSVFGSGNRATPTNNRTATNRSARVSKSANRDILTDGPISENPTPSTASSFSGANISTGNTNGEISWEDIVANFPETFHRTAQSPWFKNLGNVAREKTLEAVGLNAGTATPENLREKLQKLLDEYFSIEKTIALNRKGLEEEYTIFRCEPCKPQDASWKGTNAPRRSLQHLLGHLGVVFQCDACGGTFSSFDTLQGHKNNVCSEMYMMQEGQESAAGGVESSGQTNILLVSSSQH